MTAILTEIIQILVGGIVGMAEGIGSGLQALVTSIFITGTGAEMALSTFGGITIVFAGIALAVGLSRYVVNWLTSLGN